MKSPFITPGFKTQPLDPHHRAQPLNAYYCPALTPVRAASLPSPRPAVFKAQGLGCFLVSREEEEEEEEGCGGQGRRGGTACVGQEGWARWDRARMEWGGWGRTPAARPARRAGREQDAEAKK